MQVLVLIGIVAVLLALCIAGMGIRIWLKGAFANTEIGHNPHMKKLGIQCAKQEEITLWNNNACETESNCCSSCCSANLCQSLKKKENNLPFHPIQR